MEIKHVTFFLYVASINIALTQVKENNIEEYLNIIGNPIKVQANLILRKDDKVVTVTHGEEVRYYSKVDMKFEEKSLHLDPLRQLVQLKYFNAQFEKLKTAGTLTVLCRSLRVSKKGLYVYEPIFYAGREQVREYILIYCPGIVIDGAVPLLIVDEVRE